jgi:hypothetical protein
VIDFLKKYYPVFLICLPLWIALGNTFAVANYVVVPVCLGYFAYRKRSDYILVSLLLILIFADSVIPILIFTKSLKILVMAATTFITLYDIRRGLYHINKGYFHFLPFLFAAIVSTNWSPTPSSAVLKTVSYALLWFVGFHLVRHLFQNFGGSFLRDLTHLATLILILSFLMIVLDPSRAFFRGTPRFAGIFRNPNGMGVFITVVTPIYAFYFRGQGNVSFPTKAISYTMLIVALVLCASRTSIMSFIIFHLGIVAMQGSLPRRIFFFAGVVPIAIVLASTIDIYDVSYLIGAESYLRINDIEDGSGRILAWSFGMDFASKHLLLGCGFACEEDFFIVKTPLELLLSGHQGGVHNSYISFLINVGVVGMLLLGYFFYTTLRKISNLQILLPYVVSIAVSAFFESWMAASLNAFTIYFVIMIMVLTVGEHTKLFPIE